MFQPPADVAVALFEENIQWNPPTPRSVYKQRRSILRILSGRRLIMYPVNFRCGDFFLKNQKRSGEDARIENDVSKCHVRSTSKPRLNPQSTDILYMRNRFKLLWTLHSDANHTIENLPYGIVKNNTITWHMTMIGVSFWLGRGIGGWFSTP